jgi:hypothetical protein
MTMTELREKCEDTIGTFLDVAKKMAISEQVNGANSLAQAAKALAEMRLNLWEPTKDDDAP